MTTVAYRDGMLAADTLVTEGETKVGRTTKIYRIRGWLVGVSGDCSCSGALLAHIRRTLAAGRRKPDWPDGIDLDRANSLLVDPGGGLHWIDAGGLRELSAPFAAIGSGSEYALGAMAMGAPADVAVEIGCLYDTQSAPPVETLLLEDA